MGNENGVMRMGVMRTGVMRMGVMRTGVMRTGVMRMGVIRRDNSVTQRCSPQERNPHLHRCGNIGTLPTQ